MKAGSERVRTFASPCPEFVFSSFRVFVIRFRPAASFAVAKVATFDLAILGKLGVLAGKLGVLAGKLARAASAFSILIHGDGQLRCGHLGKVGDAPPMSECFARPVRGKVTVHKRGRLGYEESWVPSPA